MLSREWWSAGGRYGLVLKESVLAELVRRCGDSGGKETGGILVGHYSESRDCAFVTDLGPETSDSERGWTTFRRGVRGLQRWLNAQWAGKSRYYLGEWHYHPSASPTPSPADLNQMRSISESSSYCCPEPVLLIVGGDLRRGMLASAHVFPRGHAPIELVRSSLRPNHFVAEG
jgi:integrative and conjugative element protein (TIGR02256 family)